MTEHKESLQSDDELVEGKCRKLDEYHKQGPDSVKNILAEQFCCEMDTSMLLSPIVQDSLHTTYTLSFHSLHGKKNFKSIL